MVRYDKLINKYARRITAVLTTAKKAANWRISALETSIKVAGWSCQKFLISCVVMIWMINIRKRCTNYIIIDEACHGILPQDY